MRRAAGLAASAAVALGVGAGLAAAAGDPPAILVNQGIGNARMGESQVQLALDYGSFCLHGCPGKLTIGELGMTTVTYREAGGVLRAALLSNRVAVLATTSPRYRIAGRVGVGSKLATAKRWNGFRFLGCADGSGSWLRSGRAVTTTLFVKRGVVDGIELRLRKLPSKAHC